MEQKKRKAQITLEETVDDKLQELRKILGLSQTAVLTIAINELYERKK